MLADRINEVHGASAGKEEDVPHPEVGDELR
jgi:hypothetical protein